MLAASATGFGYAAWNVVGILRGDVTLLAGASYFIPVFSAAIAAAVLSTPLPSTFPQGACWYARGPSCAGSQPEAGSVTPRAVRRAST